MEHIIFSTFHPRLYLHVEDNEWFTASSRANSYVYETFKKIWPRDVFIDFTEKNTDQYHPLPHTPWLGIRPAT